MGIILQKEEPTPVSFPTGNRGTRVHSSSLQNSPCRTCLCFCSDLLRAPAQLPPPRRPTDLHGCYPGRDPSGVSKAVSSTPDSQNPSWAPRPKSVRTRTWRITPPPLPPRREKRSTQENGVRGELLATEAKKKKEVLKGNLT